MSQSIVPVSLRDIEGMFALLQQRLNNLDDIINNNYSDNDTIYKLMSSYFTATGYSRSEVDAKLSQYPTSITANTTFAKVGQIVDASKIATYLAEVADIKTDNANIIAKFATLVNNSTMSSYLAQMAPIDSPVFTGEPSRPSYPDATAPGYLTEIPNVKYVIDQATLIAAAAVGGINLSDYIKTVDVYASFYDKGAMDTELGAIKSDVLGIKTNYIATTVADAKYAPISSLLAYATKAEIASFITSTTAASTYLKKVDLAAELLTWSLTSAFISAAKGAFTSSSEYTALNTAITTMNSAVASNTSAVSTLTGEIGSDTVATSIKGRIKAIESAGTVNVPAAVSTALTAALQVSPPGVITAGVNAQIATISGNYYTKTEMNPKLADKLDHTRGKSINQTVEGLRLKGTVVGETNYVSGPSTTKVFDFSMVADSTATPLTLLEMGTTGNDFVIDGISSSTASPLFSILVPDIGKIQTNKVINFTVRLENSNIDASHLLYQDITGAVSPLANLKHLTTGGHANLMGLVAGTNVSHILACRLELNTTGTHKAIWGLVARGLA